eukprot:218089-Rhodomonas_salina.1
MNPLLEGSPPACWRVAAGLELKQINVTDVETRGAGFPMPGCGSECGWSRRGHYDDSVSLSDSGSNSA